MLEAIMLGEIPGTSIQLSFDAWLLLLAALLLLLVAAKVFKRRFFAVLKTQFTRQALRLLAEHRLL